MFVPGAHAALPMLEVLVDVVDVAALPSIDTPVSVCAAEALFAAIDVVPTKCTALNAAKSPVLFVDAVPKPKFVLAADAVVPPVPPFATATVPVTFAALPVVF